ncbi:hypothetical protein TNCV_3744671 [Trichonephila clavipes]|nr:hypothetical protein TNCV_3744671 [Trichonephila clavipes]
MKIVEGPLIKFLRKRTCHGARSRRCSSPHNFDGLTVFGKQQHACASSLHSLDLVPYDFFLFPQMKRKLKGKRFIDVDEVKETTHPIGFEQYSA